MSPMNTSTPTPTPTPTGSRQVTTQTLAGYRREKSKVDAFGSKAVRCLEQVSGRVGSERVVVIGGGGNDDGSGDRVVSDNVLTVFARTLPRQTTLSGSDRALGS